MGDEGDELKGVEPVEGISECSIVPEDVLDDDVAPTGMGEELVNLALSYK